MLDPRFAPHNTHLEAPEAFARLDPHLRRLKQQRLVYRFPLLEHLPRHAPGVYLHRRAFDMTTIVPTEAYA